MSAPGIFQPIPPTNEPVRNYAPGSPERASLQLRLEQMKREQPEIPCIIGGKEIKTGNLKPAVMPHDKEHVLANVHQGGAKEVEMAIEAAGEAGRIGTDFPGRNGPRSSTAQQSSWRARGATRSTRPRCSASRRPHTRPRSTRPAS